MPMKAKTKLWTWIGVGVVVVGGGVGYLVTRAHSTATASTTHIAAYMAETVKRGTFEGEVTTSGTVSPANEATVQAPQVGEVSQMHVSLGQKVKAGQTVATMANGQTITSPIAGTVVDLNTASGSYVSAGETLLTVANMNTVYAQVTVSEDDIRNVKTGQTVDLTLPALPNKTYTGKITAVGALGSSSSSGTVTYPVSIKIASPSGILLGMSVNATIDTGTVSNAIYVPTSAIEPVNGQAEVLVPDESLPTPSFGSGGFGGFGGFSGASGGFGGSSGGFGGGAAGFGGRSAALTHTATTIPVAKSVVLGLSNGTETQIVSGLSANQQILVPNPAAETSTTTSISGHPAFGGGFGGVGGFGGFGG
ncbi:MAG: biotin attachment protein [Sulfobacillus acidophilus]|uniref:Biotin attachment protein n=1 Tax=Sulfobacillus acidophilus TaxID=53633 RepID=A0A2T2WIT8_9FIRM|nr:MAG: biotin attachment protein [Sulfobacillus acidophilus]